MRKSGGCVNGRKFWKRNVPGQQFVNTIDRILGDAREHMAKVSLRVNIVELGRADQTVDCSGSFSTGISASEQVILPPNRDRTQRSFRRVVIDLEMSVTAVAYKRGPAPECIANCCCHGG